MEGKMNAESTLKTHDASSFLLSAYPSALIMYCEQLIPLLTNGTAYVNRPLMTPSFIMNLLAAHYEEFSALTSIPDCAKLLSRLSNSTKEIDPFDQRNHQRLDIHERSRSLIIFVILIGLVSCISIIGNLFLAKVLYSKRLRLSQTDRIVLCLAISEQTIGEGVYGCESELI